MCEFTGKLAACLDRELSADDHVAVERHLQICAECRGRVEAYREVSRAFDSYCDAYCKTLTASRPRRKLPRPVWAASGLAVAAAAVVAFLLLAPRARVPVSPVETPRPMPGAAIPPLQDGPVQAAQAAAAPVKGLPRTERSRRREQISPAAPLSQERDANGFALGPAVEIAIPADAIFPPGAIPEGVGFTADVTIAPDGSAQQIRLRPQLTEFERRSTQP